jgi:hypothetical protein
MFIINSGHTIRKFNTTNTKHHRCTQSWYFIEHSSLRSILMLVPQYANRSCNMPPSIRFPHLYFLCIYLRIRVTRPAHHTTIGFIISTILGDLHKWRSPWLWCPKLTTLWHPSLPNDNHLPNWLTDYAIPAHNKDWRHLKVFVRTMITSHEVYVKVAFHRLGTHDLCKTVKEGQSLFRNKLNDKKNSKSTNMSLYGTVSRSGRRDISSWRRDVTTELSVILMGLIKIFFYRTYITSKR